MDESRMATLNLLTESSIAILGLGLMGGSLALALRGHCKQIIGVDPDTNAVAFALEHQITDLATMYAHEILPQADVVILAAPVRAIINIIRALPELHPGKAIILDVGSTKSDIVIEMEKLPARFDPVGGHPMCGKEKLTIENAEVSLYQKAIFTLTACQNTSPNARNFANQLTMALGATPFWIDAATHDRWAAATSHFTYLVAAALTLATTMDAAPLAGPGFRSTTRLAATPPSLMVDILSTNRGNVLESLDLFRAELDQIRALLETNDQENLQTYLERCAMRREQITLAESNIESS